MMLCFMDPMALLATGDISPWWRFFGRLHPLLLHFPIALIIAAAVLELVLCWRRNARPNAIASFCLWVGMVFAVLSAWTGWEMAAHEGIADNPVKASLLGWHRWTGIVLASLSIALCLAWLIERMSRPRWAFHVYRYGLWAAGILVCFVGHFGAEMKWGQDYLFSVLRSPTANAQSVPGPTPAPESDPGNAQPTKVVTVSWTKDIEPIFQERCADCHGPDKQKGQLQLVPYEAFQSHMSVIDTSNPLGSILFHRISLPADDPDAMPPDGPRLTATQIDSIKTWISEGVPGPPVSSPVDSTEASSGQTTTATPAHRTDPATKVPSPFDTAKQSMAIDAILKLGGHASPVSEDSPWVDVNLSLVRPPVTDAQIKVLGGLKKTLIWLNLGATAVTATGLEQTVSKLTALHRLRLDRTSIGDQGLAHLSTLQALEVLNLFGTKVTDASLPTLEAMSSLKSVYLWDTGVTAEGIQALQDARPGLEVVGAPEPLPSEPPSEAKQTESPDQPADPDSED
ncbi:MAG: DUF2231 domain-containing protein [Planctomycetota bacterium]|nr:DUF2231 domain-containing protein [Planctomycetota bacterium]